MPDPRDDAPSIPGEFGVDADPYTEEDGRGDDQDWVLPEIDVSDVPDE